MRLLDCVVTQGHDTAMQGHDTARALGTQALGAQAGARRALGARHGHARGSLAQARGTGACRRARGAATRQPGAATRPAGLPRHGQLGPATRRWAGHNTATHVRPGRGLGTLVGPNWVLGAPNSL